MAGFDQTTDSIDFIKSEFWTGRYRTGPPRTKLRIIEATCTFVPTDCKACQGRKTLRVFARLRNDERHDDLVRPKKLEYRHSPELGWCRVVRVKERLRFRCNACGHTMLQPLPGMDERPPEEGRSRNMTSDCVAYILDRARKIPFVEVARNVGVSEKTVRLLVAERTPDMNSQNWVFAPRSLGIGQARLAGKMRTVYADLAKREILGIDEDRKKRSVVRWLSRLADRERVTRVQIDMRPKHREAVRQVLGEAPAIGLDHAAFIRLADTCLAKVERKAARYRIWMQKPRGKLAEDAKKARDGFLDLYRLETEPDMQNGLRRWRRSLSEEVEIEFEPLLTAIDEWRDEFRAFLYQRRSRSDADRMARLLVLVERNGKDLHGRDRSFVAARALTLEGAQLRPKPGSRRCRRCGTVLKPKMSRKFPPLVEAAFPFLADELVDACDACIEPLIGDWYRRSRLKPQTRA